ncbi:MAG: hypothetical protein JXB62_22650 [Pirellulales bacterium]|nr:hypothetical protein [Pirellulales bacterium]
MSVSYFGLLVLVGLALLVLGGLVLLAVLLANEKTRTVGIVLLLLLCVPLVAAGAAVLWLFASHPQTVHELRPQAYPPSVTTQDTIPGTKRDMEAEGPFDTDATPGPAEGGSTEPAPAQSQAAPRAEPERGPDDNAGADSRRLRETCSRLEA